MTTVTICKVCEATMVGIVRQCPECGSEQMISLVHGLIAPLSTEQRLLRLERAYHAGHAHAELPDDEANGIVRCDCSPEARQ